VGVVRRALPTRCWRSQALAWLKADLASWTKVLEADQPAARTQVQQVLQHWRSDPDLAGVRDPDARAKLPETEHSAWRALWADVDALLTKAQGGRP
jgi:hypothetical protein